MRAKTKKLVMYGVGGVAALMLLKNKGVIGSASAVNSQGAPTGSGWGALTAELDNWLDVGETRSEITNLVIPGVTKSDLEAYAAGQAYGEGNGYTEQDFMLIQQAAEWN